MSSASQLLKEKNIRVTPQRIAVYKILKDTHKHLTAEEIYSKIKKMFPRISLATVYAILDFFKNKNLIQEVKIKFDKSCFDIRVEPHHHFLCKKCKKIFDVDIPPCKTLKKKEVDGHMILEFQGYFYGICKWCVGKKGKNA